MTTITPERIVPEWDFADRLRKARLIHSSRTGARITQRDFAEMLGVKAPRYMQWEAGNAQPQDVLAVANRVEEITDVPAEWLLLGRYSGDALKVSREHEAPGQRRFSGSDIDALLEAVTPQQRAIA